jgi:CubicO group peptidase (beta-lactamase class C family)
MTMKARKEKRERGSRRCWRVQCAQTQILPEHWVDYSRRSTLGSPYGAGFWTNDGPSPPAARRITSGFPKDGFFASGNRGQRIYIIPSEHLVVARFGYSPEPDFGIIEDLRLIDAAIRALH